MRCLIHQPSYNLLNRWIEGELLDTLGELGIGCIGFGVLAQGVLTGKYLDGIPEDARIRRPGGDSLQESHLSDDNLARVRGLAAIADERGQSLAQMAIAWSLRDPRMTSALIGASRPEQVVECAGAVEQLDFTDDELAAIERYAQEGDLNLWERPSKGLRP